MNIILIIADTYRYDNLFGPCDMPVRTPHLAEFAKSAVSMSRFYCGSFPTIPQRTDLTSGRIGWPWYPWQALASSSRNSLPGTLGQAGYVSQLLCDCPHLFNTGFQHTFNAAQAVRGQEGDMPFLWMNHEIGRAMPPQKTRSGRHFQGRNLVDLHRWTNRTWRGEDDCFPPRTAGLACRWLEENYRFDPFVLWVDFFDPHEPWDPPEYMVRRYDPGYTGGPMLHPNYGRATDYTREELSNLRAHYCAEAELVDRWVGRVLQKIDDLELWRNSVVIFTTDHGICLGDHNRTGKTNINENDDRMWPLYPEIAHIPFIVAAPGLTGGGTVDAFAQPFDILPTLLDLAGVEAVPAEPFHGRSFAPLLRGESVDPLRDLAVCGSFLRAADGGGVPPCATTPMVYTDRWAYAPIGSDGRPELYDVQADPTATRNLADDNPAAVADTHARLVAWLESIDAPTGAVDWLK